MTMMTHEEIEIVENALVTDETVPEETAAAVIEPLRALRLRDWSVRVLDAYWARLRLTEGGGQPYAPFPLGDAARLAAARAVSPTLDPAKKAELGECP
jgi:hypothetical protein